MPWQVMAVYDDTDDKWDFFFYKYLMLRRVFLKALKGLLFGFLIIRISEKIRFKHIAKQV